MQWADNVKIETPEQVELSLEVAGLGSRFVAQMVDWGVKWGLVALMAILIAVPALFLRSITQLQAPPMMLLALLGALFYAFFLGYDIFYEVRRNGQTPGKKLAGIRVIRDGGAPLDFQAAAIRNLLGLVDFLPSFYLLGGLLVLLTPRGQRLGDLAAGTILVRERALRPPTDLVTDLADLAADDIHFSPEQLAACAPADRHILRSFFQRYDTLDREARDQLALRLVDSFLTRFSYPDAESLAADVFLASLYRDLEKWAKQGG